MVRALRIHMLVVVVAVLTVATLAACSGSDEEGWVGTDSFGFDDARVLRSPLAAPAPAATAAPMPMQEVVVERVVTKVVEVPGQTVVVEKEVIKEVMAMPAAPAAASVSGPPGSPGLDAAGPDQAQAQLVTQRRIIIREVDMTLSWATSSPPWTG